VGNGTCIKLAVMQVRRILRKRFVYCAKLCAVTHYNYYQIKLKVFDAFGKI